MCTSPDTDAAFRLVEMKVFFRLTFFCQIFAAIFQLPPHSPECFVNMSNRKVPTTEDKFIYWRDPCNTYCSWLFNKNPVLSSEEIPRTCLFILDNNFNHICRGISTCLAAHIGTFGQCTLKQDQQCDGISQCLTDECGCETTNHSKERMSRDLHLSNHSKDRIPRDPHNVFWCADGSGCIAFANLCDGYQNCVDGSDECMCDDVVMCSRDHNKYCVPRQRYCSKRDVYKNCKTNSVDCTGITNINDPYYAHPLRVCYRKCVEINFNIYHEEELDKIFPSYCNQSCPIWRSFCPNVKSWFNNNKNLGAGRKLPELGVFICRSNRPFSIGLEHVCDEIIDCQGGEDELGCPGIFVVGVSVFVV